MKIVLFCPQYPSSTYQGFNFVHVRAKLYQQLGHDVLGIYLGKNERTYIYENIQVRESNYKNFKTHIANFEADVIAVHFPLVSMIRILKKINLPQVAWIHGHEILWKFRLGKAKNSIDWIKKRILLIPREFLQIQMAKYYIQSVYATVFVSQWMKKKAEKDSIGKFNNSVIIPNPVDTKKFVFREIDSVKKGVSFRGFDNSKYGLDLIIKSLKNEKEISVDLIGKGRFAKKFKKMAKTLNSNVTIWEKIIPHNEVVEMYQNYSFFVAPSRVEAQGLSMCEAMACGLPVIATNVGGIPEFVRDGVDGFLVPKNDPKALFDAMKKLINNKKQWKEMGANSRNNIENICSEKIITNQELSILEEAIKNHEKE